MNLCSIYQKDILLILVPYLLLMLLHTRLDLGGGGETLAVDLSCFNMTLQLL